MQDGTSGTSVHLSKTCLASLQQRHSASVSIVLQCPQVHQSLTSCIIRPAVSSSAAVAAVGGSFGPASGSYMYGCRPPTPALLTTSSLSNSSSPLLSSCSDEEFDSSLVVLTANINNAKIYYLQLSLNGLQLGVYQNTKGRVYTTAQLESVNELQIAGLKAE
jgi:hypothetical protein